MAKKKGPPYGQPRDCKYLVISNPWGMKPAGSRQQFCVNTLGAWLNRLFEGKGTAEIVYMRDRSDAVIVQVPYDLELTPYLGAHRWVKISRHSAPTHVGKSSGVFEYNYNSQGDPANHNWADHYPTSHPPPDSFPIHIGDEYPLPDWTKPSTDLSGIAITPKFFERPKSPIPESNDTNTPIEPPPTEPPAILPAPIKQEQNKLHIVDKRDPYEEEEAAQNLLRTPDVKIKSESTDTQTLDVKREPLDDGYKPSPALVEAVRTKLEAHDPSPLPSGRPTMKTELPEQQYMPSAELFAAASMHLQQAQDHVTPLTNSQPPKHAVHASTSTQPRDPRIQPADSRYRNVKQEFGTERHEIPDRKPYSSSSARDQRMQHNSGQAIGSSSSSMQKRPKVEEDLDRPAPTYSKRQRTKAEDLW